MKTQDYLVAGLFDGLMQAKKGQEENKKMNDQNIFTENEQVILGSLPSHFRWITRDEGEGGSLRVFENIPERCGTEFVCSNPLTDVSRIRVFNHIFKGVTWENSPICFRKPILDDVERRYSKTVFKPFHNRIKYVEKVSPYASKGKCYIWACVGEDDSLELPIFDKINMYKGMELAKQYTLEELGIKYD